MSLRDLFPKVENLLDDLKQRDRVYKFSKVERWKDMQGFEGTKQDFEHDMAQNR